MIDARLLFPGKIVPVEITVELMLEEMRNNSSSSSIATSRNSAAPDSAGAATFLIDGFPRNADNLKGWSRLGARHTDFKGMIFFDCANEELERRLLKRGETSGRSDDNLEVIRKRFRTYREETLPVVRHYEVTLQTLALVAENVGSPLLDLQ